MKSFALLLNGGNKKVIALPLNGNIIIKSNSVIAKNTDTVLL